MKHFEKTSLIIMKNLFKKIEYGLIRKKGDF
jgi:hypothetical protein